MAANNPSVWASVKLFLKNPQFDSTMQYFLSQISQFGVQVQAQLTTLSSASGLATILNGSSLLLSTALESSLNDLGSPAGNSSINTKSAAIVVARLSWTTAANWTLTISNLTLGSIVLFRLQNVSGAGRTFTVTANTPASVAYSPINVFTSAAAAVNLTGGAAIANNGSITAIGITFTQGGTPAL